MKRGRNWPLSDDETVERKALIDGWEALCSLKNKKTLTAAEAREGVDQPALPLRQSRPSRHFHELDARWKAPISEVDRQADYQAQGPQLRRKVFQENVFRSSGMVRSGRVTNTRSRGLRYLQGMFSPNAGF